MTQPPAQSLAQIARRDRIRGARAMLAATLMIAAAAYGIFDSRAGVGVLLGGMAGALGFWSMSVRLERIVRARPERLQAAAVVWTYYRLAIYALFLYIAYRLDPQELHAAMGGLAGLFSTRFVVLFLAIKGGKPGRDRQSVD